MFKKFVNYVLLTTAIVCLFLKLYNIGYNSPSADEATYIKIGIDTIYKNQWGLFNTASWVGGHTYFYPTFTAIAYKVGGIEASRVLNIIFFIITTYFTYKLTYLIAHKLTNDKEISSHSAIITIILVGFSSTTAYLSRLATYDMPSFTFLIASLYFLTKALLGNKNVTNAKNFMFSSLLMSLAFGFKYIAVLYIPMAIIGSYLFIKKNSKTSSIATWIIYYIVPLTILLIALTASQIGYLFTFINAQINREHSDIIQILSLSLKNIVTILPFWLFGNYILITKKHTRIAILSFILSLVIVAFHVITARFATLDKHIFLAIVPMAITASIGISEKLDRNYQKITLLIALLVYMVLNFVNGQKYNTLWPNHNSAQIFLSQNVTENDNLLTEEGSSLLTNANTTTFDWFKYKGRTGEVAYKEALHDGYFNFVELITGYSEKTQSYKILQEKVADEIEGNYYRVYKDKYFSIYQRGY